MNTLGRPPNFDGYGQQTSGGYISRRGTDRERERTEPTVGKWQSVAFTTIEWPASLKIINKNVLIGVAPVNI